MVPLMKYISTAINVIYTMWTIQKQMYKCRYSFLFTGKDVNNKWYQYETILINTRHVWRLASCFLKNNSFYYILKKLNNLVNVKVYLY